MVLLYEHPLSPYAQKVKIALAEKGVAFECRLPDFMSGQDPAFAAANPRLEVPALVDGDTRVFDSTIRIEISGLAIFMGIAGEPPPVPTSITTAFRTGRYLEAIRGSIRMRSIASSPSLSTGVSAATPRRWVSVILL